jgi:hypothetical protein
VAVSALELDRAKKVYRAIRPLPFAELPTIDLKDRLSVLTVVAGLRRVGVLETWGQRLLQIRDRMIQAGLATSVATCVWSKIERPEETPHRDVLEVLDERRVAGKPKHVLWLYPGTEERKQLQQTSFTQQRAGALLGYPACCIAFESSVMELLPKAQLQALIAEAGNDDAKLLRRARGGALPETPKPGLPNNGLRTEQCLPFVLHVACDTCLEDADSASAAINRQNAELLQQVDADFHALFLQVQETYCQITQDQMKNRELLAAARAAHERFFRAGL